MHLHKLGFALNCYKCDQNSEAGSTNSCYTNDSSFGVVEVCGADEACYKDTTSEYTRAHACDPARGRVIPRWSDRLRKNCLALPPALGKVKAKSKTFKQKQQLFAFCFALKQFLFLLDFLLFIFSGKPLLFTFTLFF